MRREIPLIIVFVTGLFMAVQFFVPHEYSQRAYETGLNWTIIIGNFTLVLGIMSLLNLHISKIRQKPPGWGYSWLTIIFFFVMVITGLLPIDKLPDTSFFGYKLAGNLPGSWHIQFYNYILTPVQSSMFALLAFYIASASYRAFRARTLIATILLLAAIVVMLGRVPIGAKLGDWLPWLANWFISIPNAAAKRAIIIGVGFGTVSLALKIVLGIERTWLGGESS